MTSTFDREITLTLKVKYRQTLAHEMDCPADPAEILDFTVTPDTSDPLAVSVAQLIEDQIDDTVLLDAIEEDGA
jgi:hypothetical protein